MASVKVKIGADTSDLETELAIAQRQTQLAANEMRKLADAYIKGKGGADENRAALASWSSEASAAKARVDAFKWR